MKVKVLITGGAGYIGSHFARLLLREGFTVSIIDNLSTGNPSVIDVLSKATFYYGDIRDELFLQTTISLAKPDIIMHFAAMAYVGESVSYPHLYFDNNVVGSIKLLKIAQSNGIKGFVFSSTCAVYGEVGGQIVKETIRPNPISPYGMSKLVVEQLLQSLTESSVGFCAVALRYFNASGASLDGMLGELHNPETHLIPLVIRSSLGVGEIVRIYGNDYPTKDGTCERDYLHVEDLATAHFAALMRIIDGKNTSKFEVFNLGSGRPHSVLDIIKRVHAYTGVEPQVIISERRKGDPAIIFADASLAKLELGWEPKLSIDTIIDTAVQFERQRSSLATTNIKA